MPGRRAEVCRLKAMPVTQEDIAQKLGVSRRLVGYALSGHAGINAETRQRIQEMAQDMGYRPHRVAQALASGRTYHIALCFPFLGSSFYNEIIRQFEKLTRHTPYNLLMLTADSDTSGQADMHFTVDGMIFVSPACYLPEAVDYPIVALQNQVIDAPPSRNKKCDQVQIDLEEAAADAMRHLLDQGFKRIAYVAPRVMMEQQEYRYHSYNEGMREAGLETEFIALEISCEELIRRQSHEMLKNYFQENGFPDALFCCNDDVGIGAYRALTELGRRIPEETAVLGFDDIDDVRYMHPPMSAVHMPIEAVCQRAWEILLKRLKNEEFPPLYENFKAHLVVRESSQGPENLEKKQNTT
jgi:DNA-binding LacI/PurR family transcriptional regulator